MPADIDKCVAALKGKPDIEDPFSVCNFMKANGTGFFAPDGKAPDKFGDVELNEVIKAYNAARKFAEVVPGTVIEGTKDINAVEIFQTGKWNGDVFTEKDLDNIADANEKIGNLVKPFVKLGHDEGQKLIQQDGWPAAGWVGNVRRVGTKLLADLKAVPNKVAGLIERKAYGRISAELLFNMRSGDTKFPMVLKAVALLGGDTPAVKTLNDIVNLFGESGTEAVARTYVAQYDPESIRRFDDREDLTVAMTAEEEKRLRDDNARLTKEREDHEAEVKKTYDDQLAKSASELKESQDRTTKLEEEAKVTKKKYDDAQAELVKTTAANTRVTREAEVTALLDAGVRDGKVLPRQVAVFKAMAVSDLLEPDEKGVRKFAFKDVDKDKKEVDASVDFSNGLDLVKALIESNPKMVNFSEESGKGKAKPGGKNDSRLGDEKALGEKAEEYIEKQAKLGKVVTFGDAVKAVSMSRDSDGGDD